MAIRAGLLYLRCCTAQVSKRAFSQLQKGDDKSFPPSKAASSNPVDAIGVRYNPSSFDKKLLALTGFYPSSNAVPDNIAPSQMDKCRNIVRVRGTALLMLLGTIGAISASFLGKQEANRISEEVQKSRDA